MNQNKKQVEIFSCGLTASISKKESKQIDQIIKSKGFNEFLDQFVKQNNVTVITEK